MLELNVKPIDDDVIVGKIVDIEATDDYNKIKIKNNDNYNIVYDYNLYDLRVGYIVEVKGNKIDIEPNRVDNGFNYEEYLKHQRITLILQSTSIRIIKKSFSIGLIKQYFLSYIEKSFNNESLIYIKALIIGDSSGFSDEIQNAIVDNGILHLFAISGLHIGLLVNLIYKILSVFKLKEKNIEIFTCIFLLIYVIITNFTPSVIRASLVYFLSLLNKKHKLGLSSLDIISIIFILLIIINPYYMYSIGFILSFTAASIIVLTSSLIKDYSNKLQIFIISMIASIVTFPIVININNEINLLSPLINVIYIYLVELIILPLTIAMVFVPYMSNLFNLFLISFNQLILLTSNYMKLTITFPDLEIAEVLVYYSLLYLIVKFYCIKKLKYSFSMLLIIILVIFSNLTYIKSYGEVNFLDLYNGESIIIRDKYSECVAVIDTGDGKNNEVTNFLKNKGIKKVDILFLTHNHIDHNGEANTIFKKLNVNKIVVSAYDNSVLTNNMSTIKVKAKDSLNCGGIRFDVLHPDKYYPNENDNSIVLYAKIGLYKFLFLGDVSKNVENKLANMNIEVDVIKIAHHGSNTSTNPVLIRKFKPKYAVIQTGRIEKFNFPHLSTISTLNNYNVIIFRTDLNYSVKYIYTKKESIFKTIK